MFGKRISEYIAFQKVVLAILAAVGLVRLGLSLAGVADSVAVYFSMTAVVLAGVVYYGVTVHTTGFGSYKQLLPLVFFQSVVANLVAVLGIGLDIAGMHNILARPEYSGPFGQNQTMHALSHLTLGMILPTLIQWALASIVMLITKSVAKR